MAVEQDEPKPVRGYIINGKVVEGEDPLINETLHAFLEKGVIQGSEETPTKKQEQSVEKPQQKV